MKKILGKIISTLMMVSLMLSFVHPGYVWALRPVSTKEADGEPVPELTTPGAQRSNAQPANPKIEKPSGNKTLADLYFGLALKGKPIAVTPDALFAQVKELTREYRKQVDLNVVVPHFRRFLEGVLRVQSLSKENRRIIETALELLNANGLAGRDLSFVESGLASLEQHREYVLRQEPIARDILEKSSLMSRLAIPNLDYYVHVRSYHEEHALLAPFFRAFLVLSAVVYMKEDVAQIGEGLNLFQAIKESGELESLRLIEEYVSGTGKIEAVLPTTIIDSDVWGVDAVMEMLATPTVGADRAFGFGPDSARERTGLRILPRSVDIINTAIQEQMESGKAPSADIVLETLQRHSPEQIKAMGGSPAEIFLSTLGVMLDETRGFSTEARQIIVANALAAFTDQNEEMLLLKELPSVTEGVEPASPQPKYNGIYVLPLKKTYGELILYIGSEVKHLQGICASSGTKELPREFKYTEEALLFLLEMLQGLKESSEGTEGQEQMVRVDEKTGQAIFNTLIMMDQMGSKLPVIGEIGRKTGKITYLANGNPAIVSWQTIDGNTAFGALRFAYEFSSGDIISTGGWRAMIEEMRIPKGRSFPLLPDEPGITGLIKTPVDSLKSLIEGFLVSA